MLHPSTLQGTDVDDIQPQAHRAAAAPATIAVRLAAAAVQAAGLFLLTEAATKPRAWPATEPRVFEPALLICLLVPLTIMLDCGRLRLCAMMVWTLLVTAVLAGLGYHSATRGAVPALWDSGFGAGFILQSHLGVVALALFIAQVLVTDSLGQRRWVPSYQLHFDTAWQFGLQIALAVVFAVTVWGVLWLGAGLFRLVGLNGFTRLIGHDWFFYPATTSAIALSIHATDMQPALIRGARTLLLSLFSWLLPLLALLVAGFLSSLPFISLETFWRTHWAATLLLWAAMILIFLINCCYGEGGVAQLGRIKRVAAIAGAIELVPLAGLAGVALGLRVAQYGWSVARINAAAVLLVTTCYVLGYGASLVGRARLQRIGMTNVIAAYVFILVVLALLSPVADPARLMVASQVNRLESGAVSADAFDYRQIRSSGARWGIEALTELSHRQDPGSATIAAKSKIALVEPSQSAAERSETASKTMPVFPAGRTLPGDFYTKLEGNTQASIQGCSLETCTAIFLHLREDPSESLVILGQYMGSVFEPAADGSWQLVARVSGGSRCPKDVNQIKTGQITSRPHPLPDIVTGNENLTILPIPRPCS